MGAKAKAIINIVLFLLIISLIAIIIQAGKGLEIANVISSIDDNSSGQPGIDSIFESFRHPLPVFILQLIIILIASQVCGFLFKKMHQPAVMGEILAGIILGPSVVGGLFPAFTAFVFPAASLGNLQMLSQIGLVLFMFVIGMELDINLIRSKAKAAVYISNASIIVPYFLGVALSYFLYKNYAPPEIPFYGFALFMGIAMSITAFPVLARVLREKGLTNTKFGTIAITSAAAGDITGWCILAFVIAIVKAGSIASSFYTIIAAAIYVLFMLLIGKRVLLWIARRNNYADKGIRASTMAIIFLVLLLSSYCSEVIGIHALFGAFLAGVIMPEEWNFRKVIIDKIEDVALVLLLPLFFVFTGLRTQIGLLNDSSLWGICLLVIILAIAGKFGGSAIAARIKGESWHDSLAIGALMNTRGLMELVILNIGYDLGILTPQIFTIMVIMALVTTLMTSPALDLINHYFHGKDDTTTPRSYHPGSG
jgi:Kef-type K+ transport system membrane component KefB